MMKKVDSIVAQAFLNRKTKAVGNTTTGQHSTDEPPAWEMRLHGNLIAVLAPNGVIYFSMAGWGTTTTRSRLQGIGVSICQRNHEQKVGEDAIDPAKWYRLISRDECVAVDNWRADFTSDTTAGGHDDAIDPAKVINSVDHMLIGALLIEQLGLVARGGMVNTPYGQKTPVGLGAALIGWLDDQGYAIKIK